MEVSSESMLVDFIEICIWSVLSRFWKNFGLSNNACRPLEVDARKLSISCLRTAEAFKPMRLRTSGDGAGDSASAGAGVPVNCLWASAGSGTSTMPRAFCVSLKISPDEEG